MRLHNLSSGKVIQDFGGYSAPIYDVAFSGDGRFAQSGEHLWNLVTGMEIQLDGLDRLSDSQSIRGVTISKDGPSCLFIRLF